MMKQRSNSAPVPAVARWKGSGVPVGENPRDRGVALIVTLLLLFLMSVLGLAAVLSSSSDLMINGYYGNYRASFYAADSGLNIARQAIETKLAAGVPSTYAQPPISNASTLASTAQTYLTNTYGTSSPLNAGGAASSWQESFVITNASWVKLAPGSPTVTATNSNGANTAYQYIYNYNLVSVGTASGTEQASITENGSIVISVSAVPGSGTSTVSFAAFGAFINNFPACFGPLVYGTMGGPMYAKGEWNFGSGGAYTFTDPVTQTDGTFSYISSNGSCNKSGSPSYKSGSTNIDPTFESGYNLNAAAVPLPQNDYSQRWAVLDGVGCGENNGNQCGQPSTPPPLAPTLAQMNSVLKDINGNAYPSTAVPGSGVFLPYTTCAGGGCSCAGGCSLNANAGGMYVESTGAGVTTTVTLSASTTSATAQVYTIQQTGQSSHTTGTATCTVTTGTAPFTHTYTNQTCNSTTTMSGTTTYTITIDPAQGNNGTTTISSSTTGSSTTTYSTSIAGGTVTSPRSSQNPDATTSNPGVSLSGVPQDCLNTPSTAAAMVYVDGNLNITGPSGGGYAVQNNTMITVTAAGNIQQTGNLTYATEPVTTTQNQVISGSNPACCNGDPVDTLIPQYQNMNQVLGLFTAGGEFQLNPTTNGANLETDASIAAISANPTGSSGMIATPGHSVGTWTNIGGRIENSINGVEIQTGNVYFDRRFTARPNFAPPWFPSTTVSMADLSQTVNANVTVTPQRVQWVTTSGGQ